ncbi:hypothetical protein CDL12_06032 [Handroanthus impetiginosus]|uniref:Uncharacterized protein n=1 Tax=Handroanthus impetiginosus TaxID=429701 RepID=A0A2G9HUS4_9LAMI|nr:hypothetical protein CDL12_06032 [Handroanthus impetiginosus]
MSKDHNITQQESNKEPKREFEELDNIDEGYQTPTSEEHKIPGIVWSCPPPPPRKRRRLFLHNKKFDKLSLFDSPIILDHEIQMFFQSFHVESRVSPRSKPSPSSSATSKKKRIGK